MISRSHQHNHKLTILPLVIATIENINNENKR